jgi:Epoxide hydrolase N terminus
MNDGPRLEAYDWRAREADLNSLLPQFRTSLTPPPPPTGTVSSPTPLRIHFSHSPSPHANAIPLLYLHSSLGLLETTKLTPLLTHPERERDIAFHVVAPSLPGWGFGEKVELGVREVAGLWDGLMVRELGYNGGYVAVGEGGGWYVNRSLWFFPIP